MSFRGRNGYGCFPSPMTVRRSEQPSGLPVGSRTTVQPRPREGLTITRHCLLISDNFLVFKFFVLKQSCNRICYADVCVYKSRKEKGRREALKNQVN